MEKKNGPWTIKSSAEKYKSDFFTVIEDAVVKPDKTDGKYATVQLKPGVCVLPIDDENNVYLTKQFRYALGGESLEVVAGGIEKDDAPASAKLELRQELGIEAGELIDFGKMETDTSIVHCPAQFFIAKKLKFFKPEREGVEVMETVKMSFDEAVEKVLSGEIKHALSCALILKAKLKSAAE